MERIIDLRPKPSKISQDILAGIGVLFLGFTLFVAIPNAIKPLNCTYNNLTALTICE